MSVVEKFEEIKNATFKNVRYANNEEIIIEGDSLGILKSLQKNFISLILTDPPYHSTQKNNIYGDTSFSEDEHFLQWMNQYVIEWKRVLKPNGSLFCFCSSVMSARLEVLFSNNFNILSSIVWTKPNEPGFDGWKGKMKT